MIRAFALRLTGSQGTIRIWTGRGQITLDGLVFTHSKAINQIEYLQSSSGYEPDKVGLRLQHRNSSVVRNFYRDAVGSITGTLYALDKDKAVVYQFAGIAHDPVSDGQILRLVLVNSFYDSLARRNTSERFNAATQRQRGGDKSFDRAAELRERSRGLTWRSYL